MIGCWDDEVRCSVWLGRGASPIVSNTTNEYFNLAYPDSDLSFINKRKKIVMDAIVLGIQIISAK